MNPKVDSYIERNSRWRGELSELRRIALASGLEEELKWGSPCYTLSGANVALLHVFKEYCAILFVKGALLRDPEKVLITQTENVQSARQIRFTRPEQVTALEAMIGAYLAEATEVERSGAKVAFKPAEAYAVAPEFQAEMEADPALAQAFRALTPGRQKAYLLHFSSAKQEKTRRERVAKNRARILEGKGLDD